MMLIPSGTAVRIHIAVGITDMRMGMDGLAILTERVLHKDPFSGHLFAFRGRKANLIKIAFRDCYGLCLFTQRLDQGGFVWPEADNRGGKLVLSSAQLSLLLKGIDWRVPERVWRPAAAG